MGFLHPICAILESAWRNDRYLGTIVPPCISPFTFVSLLTLQLHNRSRDMSAQVHQDESVAVPTVEKQDETELSLESALDYKTWKPDRKEKMALAVQTLCVVRPARCPLYKEPADIFAQFIVSIDMTILTPTLPVGS